MAPPKLFTSTKTLELEKHPENKKKAEFKDVEQADEKKDQADAGDASGPSERTNGSDWNTYIGLLVLTGLGLTIVTVSFNKND